MVAHTKSSNRPGSQQSYKDESTHNPGFNGEAKAIEVVEIPLNKELIEAEKNFNLIASLENPSNPILSRNES